jgi:hypothetical protein
VSVNFNVKVMCEVKFTNLSIGKVRACLMANLILLIKRIKLGGSAMQVDVMDILIYLMIR